VEVGCAFGGKNNVNRLGLAPAAIVTAALAASCQGDNTALEGRLDQIDRRLAGIEEKLSSGPGAAGPGAARAQPPPARPRPSPTDVYAVPIEGAPTVGPRHAKVNVVKAFEFA
jgi:hypothetical protein